MCRHYKRPHRFIVITKTLENANRLTLLRLNKPLNIILFVITKTQPEALMKNALITLLLITPALASAQAYKCTVEGVVKYQAAPCATNPEAAPLTLKTPSAERLAKMQAQEKQRDDYWAGLKQAEAEKQKAIDEANAKRQEQAFWREQARRQRVLDERADQSWQQYQQDRQNWQAQQDEQKRQDQLNQLNRESNRRLNPR